MPYYDLANLFMIVKHQSQARQIQYKIRDEHNVHIKFWEESRGRFGCGRRVSETCAEVRHVRIFAILKGNRSTREHIA